MFYKDEDSKTKYLTYKYYTTMLYDCMHDDVFQNISLYCSSCNNHTIADVSYTSIDIEEKHKNQYKDLFLFATCPVCGRPIVMNNKRIFKGGDY